MSRSIDITGRRRVYRWRTNGVRWVLSAGRGVVAKVLPDATYARMFRIDMGDGVLSDMTNLTRAKDGAIRIADARIGKMLREAAE